MISEEKRNTEIEKITEITNNLVLAVSLDNKYGYINESEENIIPFSYFEGTEEFNNKGYAIANSNNKYGVINKKNKIIIPFEYDYLEQVKDNLYISIKNNKYNLINLKNNKVGNTYEVLIEEQIENNVYVGRTQFDAEEIDSIVYVKSHTELEPGDFVNVKINTALEYDLMGDIQDEFAK